MDREVQRNLNNYLDGTDSQERQRFADSVVARAILSIVEFFSTRLMRRKTYENVVQDLQKKHPQVDFSSHQKNNPFN